MTDKLRPVTVYDIPDNAFKLIADDWMLITAGGPGAFNTMTASWGGVGELWHRKIAICFVRPTRYTYEFMNRHEFFTLTFFDERYREVLNLCGRRSGRDFDKMGGIGLTPIASPRGSVYFAEARLVLECRKVYTHDLDPARFLDPAIEQEYPRRDYHRMYIGQIETCLRR
ncbi:MAG TPA: flavin reductase family protein [candidate division Zixibacteria bacterium]|nr:flavin reductase family protein [candidate division Zixibacteria bacterium]MDD4918645.1 flavin reductase family protein [candidate division Zixibacteria bacterium]MDM7971741.1 flavin reductase family protein [candidate division Zixibacteria bacterium]HOD67156.1 flavin reductase family protein [candidate division Zixibacteria bacterium]HOZ08771.1 flavin reductase family protein [candidate division Zixibacteria bacterium]